MQLHMQIVYLAVAALGLFFLFRSLRTGAISYRYGSVARVGAPVAYWTVVVGNAVITLGAFLVGFGFIHLK